MVFAEFAQLRPNLLNGAQVKLILLDLIRYDTVRCTDTSHPKHFDTSAELSVRHIGTGNEVSGHIGTDVLQVVFQSQQCPIDGQS